MKKKLVIIALLLVVLQMAISAPAAYAAPPADGGNSYHEVQQGETLFSIGRLYGVDPYDIAYANGLYNPNYIYEGQVLYVPSGNCCRPGRGPIWPQGPGIRMGPTPGIGGQPGSGGPLQVGTSGRPGPGGASYGAQVLYNTSGNCCWPGIGPIWPQRPDIWMGPMGGTEDGRTGPGGLPYYYSGQVLYNPSGNCCWTSNCCWPGIGPIWPQGPGIGMGPMGGTEDGRTGPGYFPPPPQP